MLFVKTLLATLADSLPVDREQVHLTGASNGGMLVYTLASDPDFATAFGGLVPVYGGILQGQLVPSFPSQARLLSMHDRSDTEIPPDGGIAQDGWLCTRRTLSQYPTLGAAQIPDACRLQTCLRTIFCGRGRGLAAALSTRRRHSRRRSRSGATSAACAMIAAKYRQL